ncbi:MAG: hypothetical protein WC632_05760, partial [Candidatus Margulisiibacteriota bacterium]
MRIFSRVLSAFFILLLAGIVWSAVPTKISYEGRLTDASGNPVTTEKTVSFKIYDAETAGNLIWGAESQTVTPDSQGVFSVLLGATEPITAAVFNAATRYLEISVGGETISPRTPIVSVGYAFRAATADNIEDSAITDSKIAAGTITNAKVASGQFVKRIIAGSGIGVSGDEGNGTGQVTLTAAGTGGGTITQVNSGTGLTGGPITTTGTLAIDTSTVITTSNAQTLSNKTFTGTATMAAVTATALDMGNNKITSLATPTAATDAANKAYVDSSAPGTGANAALSNLSSVAVNTSLLPGTTNSIDLGSADKTWQSGYIGTSLVFKGLTNNTTITLDEPSQARSITIPNKNGRFVVAAGGQVNEEDISNGAVSAAKTNITALDSTTGKIKALDATNVANLDGSNITNIVATMAAYAINSGTLNNQDANYYTNADNITAGTINIARVPTITADKLNVAAIDSTSGKIKALDATNVANLDGSNITNITATTAAYATNSGQLN